MLRSFALVVSMVVISIPALPGCSSAAPAPATAKAAASSQAPAAPTAAKPTSETPKHGGILTSVLNANPPSLDAQQESTLNTAQVVSPIYGTLVQAHPLTVDKWAPGLAEKWKTSQ